jgi:hypothetical protein
MVLKVVDLGEEVLLVPVEQSAEKSKKKQKRATADRDSAARRKSLAD